LFLLIFLIYVVNQIESVLCVHNVSLYTLLCAQLFVYRFYVDLICIVICYYASSLLFSTYSSWCYCTSPSGYGRLSSYHSSICLPQAAAQATLTWEVKEFLQWMNSKWWTDSTNPTLHYLKDIMTLLQVNFVSLH
jgi:hypothetical protein